MCSTTWTGWWPAIPATPLPSLRERSQRGGPEALQGAGGRRGGADRPGWAPRSIPAQHEAVSTTPAPDRVEGPAGERHVRTRLPLQGCARAPGPGAGLLRPGPALRWLPRTSIRSSAFQTRPARPRSRRPIVSWRSSITPTPTRITPSAAERFKEISEAHSTLSDPEKRKQYDQMRRYGAFDGMPRRPSGAGAGESRRRGWVAWAPRIWAPRDSSSETWADWATSSPRCSDADGARRRGGRGRYARSGGGGAVPGGHAGRRNSGDLTGDGNLPTCKGSGGAPGATFSTCPECKGQGTISFGQGSFAVSRPCPQCRGRGKIPSEKCPTCRGAGEVRTERRIVIPVPPGTETRLPGSGCGDRDSPAGPVARRAT